MTKPLSIVEPSYRPLRKRTVILTCFLAFLTVIGTLMVQSAVERVSLAGSVMFLATVLAVVVLVMRNLITYFRRY